MVTPGPPGNTVLMLSRIQGQIFHLNSLGRSLYVSNITDTASIIGNIHSSFIFKTITIAISVPRSLHSSGSFGIKYAGRRQAEIFLEGPQTVRKTVKQGEVPHGGGDREVAVVIQVGQGILVR